MRTAFIDFPPFKYVDDEGNAAGPWVEFSEKLAEQAGYQLEWIELPISRVYRQLISGEVDLWPGLAGIPELDGAVLETDLTPLSLTLAAYHKSDQPEISGIEELRGKDLILISGFTYLGFLDDILASENTTVARSPNHGSALRMLSLGRGQYMINYDEPVKELLADNPMEDLRQSLLVRVRGAFVISKQMPGAETLKRDFEEAFRVLDLETLSSGNDTQVDDVPE
ncbi:MAG: transporter substrate-binding domain-containing protein [Oleiphilaceae bacterium]|nr:transporter substrate-binding domain-containing protein [Oleiphilaceae bacterium]